MTLSQFENGDVLFIVGYLQKSADEVTTTVAKLRRAAGYFCNPALVLLCIGGAVRNGAGLVWAYNLVIFFDAYHPDTRVIPATLSLSQYVHVLNYVAALSSSSHNYQRHHQTFAKNAH